MKPVLVFDWNGTLLDDAYALLETTNAILDRFGRTTIDMKTLREHCDVPLSLLYRSLGLSRDELATVDRDGSAMFHDAYEALAGRADLREGARRVLELARREGASSIIVSNHIVDPLRYQLRRLGINDCIDDVLAFESRDTQYKSTSKGERLRLYMQKNNLKPASTFIIGDMPIETDIARNLGLISIAITGGFVSEARLQAAHPDYTINNLHELLPILRSYGFFGMHKS
ncbi:MULTISPECIES: HAD family hydrolase [Bradyrhizobium]|uniref:HAD family hydrolase n=1 Tax=Bradyrhizobium TaxID=374 RepID=UPI00025D2018|nr:MULTISPECIES: HAD family hydrolase [Bradyrhizobium]EIG58982.1 putative phosphatase [Bradyrhizobium sp. WSM1253]MBM7485156.1 phosphoglycolate phosphatase [Bradyrhizobium canariense]MBW5437946.1 HAD family hydrolase [Bradyrhizobium canariense]MCS3762343.1 phosphoglycolate phosphatase [Bradyrhizobium centrosematis]MCS3775012.1 phosphoglycolate phosphatase [Bradyrhizobium centrosematis]